MKRASHWRRSIAGLAAMAVLFIVPSASAATRSTAKVTAAGSVVKAADGSITASATFSSKEGACLRAVPISPSHPPVVDFSYPARGPEIDFKLLQVGRGRWQIVLPPDTSDYRPNLGEHPVFVSTANQAYLFLQVSSLPDMPLIWHVKKHGSRISCKLRTFRDALTFPL